MSKLDKIRLAASLVAVVCAGTALQLAVDSDLRIIPALLAYAAYRSGTLLAEARLRSARGEKGGA